MIYQLALGDSTLNIIELKQRLAHIECTKYSFHCGIDIDRTCIPHADSSQRHPTWSNDNVGWDFDYLPSRRLGLLRTCRQIHKETAHILYEANTFDFTTAESFNFFTRTTTLARLASLRSISIGFYMVGGHTTLIRTPLRNIKYNPSYPCNLSQDWDPMWNTIKTQMHGLKHLLVVVFGQEVDDPEQQISIVEPMKGLTRLPSFRLEMRKETGPGLHMDQFALVEHLSSTLSVVHHATSTDT